MCIPVTAQRQPCPCTGWSFVCDGSCTQAGRDVMRACSGREGGPETIRFLAQSLQHLDIRKVFFFKNLLIGGKSQIFRTSRVGAQTIMWISEWLHPRLGPRVYFITCCWSGSVSWWRFPTMSLKPDVFFSEPFICWIWLWKLGHWVLWQTHKIKSQPEVHCVSSESDKLHESYGNESKCTNSLVIVLFVWKIWHKQSLWNEEDPAQQLLRAKYSLHLTIINTQIFCDPT